MSSSTLIRTLSIIGLIIVLFDGLTRALPDGAVSLTHASTLGTWFFGLATLILILSSGEAISWKEKLVLWFLLGTVTFTKDFAYLHVVQEVYVTDIVLVLVLAGLIHINGSRPVLKVVPGSLWFFFWAGVLSAARGLLGGSAPVLVARDFLIPLYILFVPIGFWVFDNWRSIRRAISIFCLGTALSVFGALAWFINLPGQRRYIGYGVYVLATLLGCVLLISLRVGPQARLRWISFLMFIGLLLSNARTLYVLAAGIIAFLFIFGPVPGSSLWPRVRALLLPTVLLLTASALFLQTKAGQDFVDRSVEELISGTDNYQEDPNALFRFLAWREALQRFQANPAIGEGYGVPFIFALSDNDPRPHNTYLTVLYKMGTLGFLALVSFLVVYFWGLVRAARKPGTYRVPLFLLLLLQMSMCGFGALNLMLESPYLASVFWLSVGITLRLRQIAQEELEGRIGLSVAGLEAALQTEAT